MKNNNTLEHFQAVKNVLENNKDGFALVVECSLSDACTFDFSANNSELAQSELGIEQVVNKYVESQLRLQKSLIGVGKYAEDRVIYNRGSLFSGTDEARTLHLGLDIFAPVGTAVFAPLPAIIHSFQDNAQSGDYGPTIILEHKLEGVIFYTLYGHLSRESLPNLRQGKQITAGQKIAELGSSAINGGWPPHLHFEIITDMLGRSGDFPGVAKMSEKDYWLSVCLDPMLIINVEPR